MELREIQKSTWKNKKRKGYNTADVPLEFCMLNEKSASAFTSWRNGDVRLGEELADAILYLSSIAEMNNIDIQDEVEGKIRRNLARPD